MAIKKNPVIGVSINPNKPSNSRKKCNDNYTNNRYLDLKFPTVACGRQTAIGIQG